MFIFVMLLGSVFSCKLRSSAPLKPIQKLVKKNVNIIQMFLKFFIMQ